MEQGSAIGGENAAAHFHPMVELGGSENLETGTDGAALGIVGGIDQAGNTSLDNRASAHRAGFESDVERGVSETVVAEGVRGFANGDDFRMGSGIGIANGTIAGTREDFFVMNEDSADGDLAGLSGGPRFVESEVHEVEVVRHWWVEDSMATRN